MTVMRDTEHQYIPRDLDGKSLFDINLSSSYDGFDLNINIPAYFEYGDGRDAIYDSEGFLWCPFEDVLEEYIKDTGPRENFDRGRDLVVFLRKCADRLEKEIDEFDDTRAPEELPGGAE